MPLGLGFCKLVGGLPLDFFEGDRSTAAGVKSSSFESSVSVLLSARFTLCFLQDLKMFRHSSEARSWPSTNRISASSARKSGAFYSLPNVKQ